MASVMWRNPKYTYSDLLEMETMNLEEIKKSLEKTRSARGDFVWVSRIIYFIDHILHEREATE